MAQKLGIEKLRHKLSVKQTRVSMRYNYYEMKNTVRDLQISTPPALKGWFRGPVGRGVRRRWVTSLMETPREGPGVV